MFRQIRKIKQALSKEECEKILLEGSFGTLAVLGDNEYPYSVPLNYVYSEGKIIFHSAKEGHKTDSIRKNNKASFCVVAKDDVVPEEFTSYFSSVIVFGKVKILETEEEKRSALYPLAKKFSPMETEESVQGAMERNLFRMNLLELEIEHMTGKQAIELVKKKQ